MSKKPSTFLGDEPIDMFVEEEKAKALARERKHKALLVERMSRRIKNKQLTGVERGQILKGMGLLEVYKRRLRRK